MSFCSRASRIGGYERLAWHGETGETTYVLAWRVRRIRVAGISIACSLLDTGFSDDCIGTLNVYGFNRFLGGTS